jgi:hypothetical protein
MEQVGKGPETQTKSLSSRVGAVETEKASGSPVSVTVRTTISGRSANVAETLFELFMMITQPGSAQAAPHPVKIVSYPAGGISASGVSSTTVPAGNEAEQDTAGQSMPAGTERTAPLLAPDMITVRV